MLLNTFDANTVGRDFVIGDLHGAMPSFLTLLEGLKFDPAVDRMFSVGDLIDRGPASLACLNLLLEDWFHAVQANHEEFMLEAFKHLYDYLWTRNGGEWGSKLLNEIGQVRAGQLEETEEHRAFQKLLTLAANLPALITIRRQRGDVVHVIHAEIPQEADGLTDDDLADEMFVRELYNFQCRDGSFLLWGRERFRPFAAADLSNQKRNVRIVKNGLHLVNDDAHGPIISGHTVLQRPMTIFKRTAIDTGATFEYRKDHQGRKIGPRWAGLTALDINSWEFFKATSSTFEQVEPVCISIEDVRNDTED